ncbi:methyltransferase, FxLD system [Phytomonospora endophytica]|uniref:Protein-L-isoaspartate O-methyltransferase n=1 Tax=Phytomonospora endophytica TaxID=714109 RepID=A0A841FNM2_9ACTN|nr:methyltransferase, FxLD system [Phytomonospora endophytica]MBB6037675.1 protein-L-isoaspartate(D-aspartate) O-methyltransferase [Phytomonospora endophytica]GIG67799.1 hypothetical protein Pen01_40940 [Phytomonospora endophytica]
MTTLPEQQVHDPGVLRADMIRELQAMEALWSPPVIDAVAAVPRHLFAPGEPLEAVYEPNTPLVTKWAPDGKAVSSLSATAIQTVMLEQAEITPGMKVLEIGSGGYNAALLAELVGPDGHVTTVDIDPDITDRARSCLNAAGYERVDVVTADAEHGVASNAPYDRIIVTVGAWDIPPAWLDQLTADGRIVVPLRFAGLTRSIAFDRTSEGLASVNYYLSGFVAIQGAGEFNETLVSVTDDAVLRLDERAPKLDIAGLRAAFDSPRREYWSSAAFDLPDELELFLVTSAPVVPLLHVSAGLVESGAFAASAGRGVPVMIDGDSFAYRTKRANDAVGGFESGVIAHGSNADQVAERYLQLLRDWATNHRRRGAAQIGYLPATSLTDIPAGTWQAQKNHGRITVSWG